MQNRERIVSLPMACEKKTIKKKINKKKIYRRCMDTAIITGILILCIVVLTK
jgi:hypothetical protein